MLFPTKYEKKQIHIMVLQSVPHNMDIRLGADTTYKNKSNIWNKAF